MEKQVREYIFKIKEIQKREEKRDIDIEDMQKSIEELGEKIEERMNE